MFHMGMTEVLMQTFSWAVIPSSYIKGIAVLFLQFLWKDP